MTQVDLNMFKPLLKKLVWDNRITVSHVALIVAIMQLAQGAEPTAPIFISRKMLLKISHIGSIVTYHKCIKELVSYRIIDYFPSYHPGIRSKVFFIMP